ncbi:MAG: hypothetical protein ACR2OZ_08870 [Verrucomicrobiales bacterium]
MPNPISSHDDDVPSTAAHPQGVRNWAFLAIAVFVIVTMVLGGLILIFS